MKGKIYITGSKFSFLWCYSPLDDEFSKICTSFVKQGKKNLFVSETHGLFVLMKDKCYDMEMKSNGKTWEWAGFSGADCSQKQIG